jgi:hypothetical protein
VSWWLSSWTIQMPLKTTDWQRLLGYLPNIRSWKTWIPLQWKLSLWISIYVVERIKWFCIMRISINMGAQLTEVLTHDWYSKINFHKSSLILIIKWIEENWRHSIRISLSMARRWAYRLWRSLWAGVFQPYRLILLEWARNIGTSFYI